LDKGWQVYGVAGLKPAAPVIKPALVDLMLSSKGSAA
jgi:hypothetical protein